MALPTFFVIGAARSGTTSLHSYLSQHPQIGMSRRKETNFFVGPENIDYPAIRISDPQEYESLFDGRFPVRGEASPSYAEYPRHRGAPERIHSLIPAAKFIYVVRDPVDRALSHYWHKVAREGERRSLKEAFADVQDPNSPYICPSLYHSQLMRYLRFFPLERIAIIDQVDLRTQTRETLRGVFTFLGVAEDFDCAVFDEQVGGTHDARIYPPRYVRFAERAAKSPLGWLPRSVKRPLRQRAEQVMWRRLPSEGREDRDVRRRLAEAFRPEVDQLRQLTGCAFSGWGPEFSGDDRACNASGVTSNG